MPLTVKQQAFVAEYLVDLNATQAAMRAGYSRRTAAEQGARLTKHPQVAAAIAKALEQRADKAAIDANWVLKKAVELHEAALADKSFAAAKGALELVGKHVDIQAFRERVAHGFDLSGLTPEELATLERILSRAA